MGRKQEVNMSAIIGIHHFHLEPIATKQITDLFKPLRHYPADDVSTWIHNGIFLGCHAQWITPESINEKLPFYDNHRQLAITADAIIDNRDELFAKLQVNKGRSKMIPDSQLILLAYDKWGEEAPKHLIGDFAFMIWDERKQLLFGARDFSGARTLYVYHDQQRVAFSTTIEPLFTLPYVKKILNEEWLAEFLAIPTMVEAVDPFSTVYQSIHQIPPSHSMTVKNGRVTFLRYLTIEADEFTRGSNEEYEEAFRDVLQQSVKSRLRTRGQVGSHLSGGLDSGTVVSLAAKALQKEQKSLHTFSYIPENSFIDWTHPYYLPDERPFIKETVNYVGNITDHYLNFEGKSPLSEVDDFLELMEMPYKFFENSFWLKGIMEAAHQRGINVLLNGARGNHSISWGSWNLTMEYYASLFKKLKWVTLFQQLDDYTKHFQTGKSNMLPIIVQKAFPAITRLRSKHVQEDYRFQAFIHPSLARKTKVYEKLQEFGMHMAGGSIDNLAEYRRMYYQQLYPWNKSGVVGTKLSLRYSLWDRDPTNDLRVINFCLSIPEEQYVLNGLERSLIRRATKDLLPHKVRLNQHSRGIQGADVIHRMAPNWKLFIDELHQLSQDERVAKVLDIDVIKSAISKIGDQPESEIVFADEFKILTRSLIVYRFLKKIS